MTMYNAIVSTYRNVVSKHEQFKGMIPSGTAIQNLRTSYIGDNLTRDTLHLDYANGRYTAAMTWYARLTGGSTEAVSWVPDAYRHVGWDLEAIREAVNNAIKTPLAVTQSKLTEAPDRLTDAEYFEKLGVDMEDYELLNWQDTVGAFYDSRRHANMISTDSISKYYSCSAFLTYEDIPVGSVIIVDEGYQYRPEGWIDASTTNSSSTRPGNVTTPAVYVTGDWWGDFTIRAFNLSKKPNADMTVADGAHLRIYVPKAESPDAATFEQMGLDVNDYELLDWQPTVGAFYNSSIASLGTGMDTTGSVATRFICSVLLYKNDLPEGAVIIVDNGYQYRPEGWIDAGTNNSSATRPGNVTTMATVVDAAWWGNFTIRAFNLSKTEGGSMNAADAVHLRIYIPKNA